MNRKALKCVVVGDGGVGKTTLLRVYVHDVFPEPKYVHCHLGDAEFCKNMLINDVQYEFELCDTKSQDEYSILRTVNYPQTVRI